MLSTRNAYIDDKWTVGNGNSYYYYNKFIITRVLTDLIRDRGSRTLGNRCFFLSTYNILHVFNKYKYKSVNWTNLYKYIHTRARAHYVYKHVTRRYINRRLFRRSIAIAGGCGSVSVIVKKNININNNNNIFGVNLNRGITVYKNYAKKKTIFLYIAGQNKVRTLNIFTIVVYK